MSTNICFAYPWATFGGCERVFINRAMAFKKYLPDVKVDFLFLSDGGGLEKFNAALEKYDLKSVASVVRSLDKPYDLVSFVDCPQLFQASNLTDKRYIVECHTAYTENRRYLRDLPYDCSAVIAPSTRFATQLKGEFPEIRTLILPLTNFVPWDIDDYQIDDDIVLPGWVKRPILFFGRMDRLKDPFAVLDAFEILQKSRKNEFMILLCGPQSVELNIREEIAKRGLLGDSVILPPVPFHAVSAFMHAVQMAGGIFVSPSRGESFGLSAAEAISSILPPVLSDIDAHLDLLGEYGSRYTYPLSDSATMAARIEYHFDHWLDGGTACRLLRKGFSAERFIGDWEILLNQILG